MVGAFNADFYQINGMVLESRKRREHLSEEDLQKNKAIMESLTKGNSQGFKNGEVRNFNRNKIAALIILITSLKHVSAWRMRSYYHDIYIYIIIISYLSSLLRGEHH